MHGRAKPPPCSVMEMQYKLAIIVRNDLKLSKGKVASQVAHASVTCSLNAKTKAKEWFKKWYDEGQRKVVLKVDTLKELYLLKESAEQKNLTVSLIADAGLTEVKPGTVTCLGIGPAPEELVDGITGKLKLL